jgi:hypothetical protein
MWLLNVNGFRLEEFFGDDIPSYGILSHTWDEPEITFHDIRNDMADLRKKASFDKIENCCKMAQSHGLQHVWIDTCCIDKSSSAELSESLNSMYGWYERSMFCYVYLADISKTNFHPSPEAFDAFRSSRWFTRGWTLQELIAPPNCTFYSKDWEWLGTKQDDTFREKLSRATGIPSEILADSENIRRMSIAQRMSWASGRRTTRPEDMAYSILGLFGVSIPILYGEGARKAFKRLQLEIISLVPDQTIFAWRATRTGQDSGLLAESPADFADSSSIVASNQWSSGLRPYTMTNLGLAVTLPLSPLEIPGIFAAAISSWKLNSKGQVQRIRIFLRKIHEKHTFNFLDRTS